jgi:hypothetical protein
LLDRPGLAGGEIPGEIAGGIEIHHNRCEAGVDRKQGTEIEESPLHGAEIRILPELNFNPARSLC